MSGDTPSLEEVLHRREVEDQFMRDRAEILKAVRESDGNKLSEAIMQLLVRMYAVSAAHRLERKKLEARIVALEELVTRP